MDGWTGPPEIDHRAQAQKFHRRAQRAEAALERAQQDAGMYRRLFFRAAQNRNTAKRSLKRAQAKLRAVRLADPLTRIIELGKLFP